MTEGVTRIKPRRARWILLVVAPLALGLAGAYAIHLYQAGQNENNFHPYRPPNTEMATMQSVTRAYSYIATPMSVAFGEIENFKRYRAEWDIVNSGLKTLEIELVSHSCKVEFDGQPMPQKFELPGRGFGTIALTWVEAHSDPRFEHQLVLKTNDDVPERRELKFQVSGSVSPVFDLQPNVLDFGVLADGETKELVAKVVSYKTKNFRIDDFSFTDEAVRAGFDVQISPISDLSAAAGERKPASGYQIVVTARAAGMEKKPISAELLLKSNLPEVEGLAIQLRADRR